jgi:outer membrane protein OmpA-like peptidoglycan-associated protein
VTSDDLAIGDAADDGYAWPAFVDLLAASTLVVVIFLAVFVYQKVIDDTIHRNNKTALLTALSSAANSNGNFTVIDAGQLIRIVLQDDVTFPTAEYTLDHMKPEGIKAVARIGVILKDSSVQKNYQQILVVGHTDRVSTGQANWTNWELSAARAAVVARQLVTAGVDPCVVSASGAGRYYPVTKNARTPAELKTNRRIEIEVLPALTQQASDTGDRCEKGTYASAMGGVRDP